MSANSGPHRSPTPPALLGALLAMMLIAPGCTGDASQSSATTAADAPATVDLPTITAPSVEHDVPTELSVAPAEDLRAADELVAALYSALNARDLAAFRALSTADAEHHLYYYGYMSGGIAGYLVESHNSDSSLNYAGIDGVEVMGDVIVSGDTLTVPVRFTYWGEVETGFDVLVIDRGSEGWRVAGGAVFFAWPPDSEFEDEPNPWDVIAAEIVAWNAGDAAAVRATMGAHPTLWDDVTDRATTHWGGELTSFLEAGLGSELVISGPYGISGPYLAVPTRVSTAGESSQGISIYLIRDGKIVLHGFAQ